MILHALTAQARPTMSCIPLNSLVVVVCNTTCSRVLSSLLFDHN